VVSFDYRLFPDVRMEMEVAHGTGNRDVVRMNDPLVDRRKPLPMLPELVADGRWHRAEFPLHASIRARHPRAEKSRVHGIRFINWDLTAVGRLEYGRTGRRGSFWCIDNFRILGYGGSEAAFRWNSIDENGIAGYSWALDRRPDTVPTAEATGRTELKRKDLADGRWYLHVRARDGVGNWSPVSHHMIIVDTEPPTAEALFREGMEQSCAEPLRFRIDDAGSGLDPYSVRLRVGARTYGIEDAALQWDASESVLTFDPASNEPHPLLFADGGRVGVELLSAADHAGHSAERVLSTHFVARSPLSVTPATPDGENGWYVTPPQLDLTPPPGGEVLYEWRLPPSEDDLFQRGNTINELTAVVSDPRGDEERYSIPIKMDRTVPGVRARKCANGRIELMHDDYAYVPGGLNATVYAMPDFQGEALCRRKIGLGLSTLPRAFERAAGSVRWRGKLRAPKTEVYTLALSLPGEGHCRITVDGDTIVETPGRREGRHETNRRVLLRDGLHDLVIEWDRGARRAGSIDFTLKGEEHGELGPGNWYTREPLARVYYRWDDGRERPYEGPLTPPPGGKVLHVRAVDRAGHESEGRFERERIE
jgi:hypothetical protein